MGGAERRGFARPTAGMVAAVALVLALLAVGRGDGSRRASPLHAHTIASVSVAGGTSCASQSFPLEPLAQAQQQAAAMVQRMTLEQEVTLMHGVFPSTPPSGTVGSTAAIPSLGIPALTQQDGPGGVGDNVTGVTQLPAPEALAATFDPTAAQCYGQVIGDESRAKGVNLVYGPTVNIVRVPQWGRAFESLGEDPVLTGTIGSAEVQGIQNTGTMAEVKHYAVYNQEVNRNTPLDNAIVDQKTLQEIYLRAWDQIMSADPAAIMCSYSTINGTDACENSALIKTHLDGTLHFPGFVGSDYEATHSTVAAANAGLDQEQPESVFFGQALVAAVEAGQVSRATIDEAARRILTEMYRFGLFTNNTTGSINNIVTNPADAQVANQVAEESTTLLKNSAGALPLSSSGGPIAMIGPAAGSSPTTVGNGSATVTAPYQVTPVAGLQSALGGSRQVTYTAGLPASSDFQPIPATDIAPPFPHPASAAYTGELTAPETGTYLFAYTEPDYYQPITLSIDGTPLVTNPGTPQVFTYVGAAQLTAGKTYNLNLNGPAENLTWVTPSLVNSDIASAAAAAKTASTAVVVVADNQASEAADRASLNLPSAQDELVSAVAAANPHTVVVVDTGGPVLMPWLSQVSAVVDAWYPGQTDSSALAAVLLGNVDPSGHLPMTFPASPSVTPVSKPAQFPGVNGQVAYSEGVDAGYRWYDATGNTPLFPFGFGLSYTTFSYSHPTVHVGVAGGQPQVTATVQVTNTGSYAGADVAQLYLGLPAVAADPPRQLEAFQRVSLASGQSTKVTFSLQGMKLAY
ncbi:MAG: beta-glucosidase [Acidimicrobiaceae bacterium]|nr:beta-glucosidase [Acidimicrobiaceae bacterium]